MPNDHTLAVLALTAMALFLFSREKIPLETSALSVLALLTVGFELFPYDSGQGRLHAVDFFSGFGHEALVAVSALMIAGYALVRTGALEPVGRLLAKSWSLRPGISSLLTLIIAGVLSAFINNTPIVILLLPILVSVAMRTGSNATSLLMPMGFATLIGGMSTTIGTSTNLLVIGVAADMGGPRLGMFDFVLPAAIANAFGLLYLWLLAPRILPRRQMVMTDTSPRVFSAFLEIREGGKADGKRLSELIELTHQGMRVEGVRRSDNVQIVPLPDAVIRAGDRLFVVDTPSRLKEFEGALGATLYSGADVVDDDHPLKAQDQQLAEGIVFRGSALENRTLNDVRFLDRYHMAVLAIHRARHQVTAMPQGVGNLPLRLGDVLLLQGTRECIDRLKQHSIVMVLDSTTDLPRTRKAGLSLLIMLGIVLLAALKILPIAVSATGGVLLMILFRCISWRDVSQALSVQVILLIVASLALGNALLATGGSEFLASGFIRLTEGATPPVILSGLMLLMALLTNLVSNNAAAVIGTPVAVNIATSLGLPATPFILAVLFGANLSFATPMAYQTNLLVMSAGNYRFSDFVRAGLP